MADRLGDASVQYRYLPNFHIGVVARYTNTLIPFYRTLENQRLNMSSHVQLCKFLNSISRVVTKSARIARLIRSDNHLLQLLIQRKSGYTKNERFIDDFKTLTDVLIQELIKYHISEEFPHLKDNIYGEESNVFTNTLGETVIVKINESEEMTQCLLEKVLNGNHVAAGLLSKELHSSMAHFVHQDYNQFTESVDTSMLSVWIDPIDATEQYIKGYYGQPCERGFVTSGLQACLVLVGVYDRMTGQPLIGVIDQPFCYKEDNNLFKSCHTWGVSLNRTLSTCTCNSALETFPLSPNQKPVLLISESERNLMTNLQDHFDIFTVAGAGYKCLCVFNNFASAYISTKSTTFAWDTCACHAVLKAVDGGIVSLQNAMRAFKRTRDIEVDDLQITYNQNVTDAANTGGIIAYRNKQMLKCILSTIVESGLFDIL